MRWAFRFRAASCSPDILLCSSRVTFSKWLLYLAAQSTLFCAKATKVIEASTAAAHKPSLDMQDVAVCHRISLTGIFCTGLGFTRSSSGHLYAWPAPPPLPGALLPKAFKFTPLQLYSPPAQFCGRRGVRHPQKIGDRYFFAPAGSKAPLLKMSEAFALGPTASSFLKKLAAVKRSSPEVQES